MMQRRGFFTRVSGLLALFGIGTAERVAAARPVDEPQALAFDWKQVDGPSKVYPDGVVQTVETLEGTYARSSRAEWCYTGRLVEHRLLSGHFWRYEVELDWVEWVVQSGISDPRRASSWHSDLEETRARAELALKLLIDTKRVENLSGPCSSLRLLSAQHPGR